MEAGETYGQLAAQLLDREGYALHNLASLPHISAAGACATATHGSGDGNQILASIVSAMELVTADGTVQTLSETPQRPSSAFGALGVVTKLTLKLQPTFVPSARRSTRISRSRSGRRAFRPDHEYSACQRQPLHQLANATTSSKSGSSDGRRSPAEFRSRASRDPRDAERSSADPSLRGALHRADELLPGAWHDRLPHFRMGFTPPAKNSRPNTSSPESTCSKPSTRSTTAPRSRR